MQMITAAQQSQGNKEPSPEDQKDLAQAQLTNIKAQQIMAEMQGLDAETQLDVAALMQGKPKVYS
jgi:hypothetical protein